MAVGKGLINQWWRTGAVAAGTAGAAAYLFQIVVAIDLATWLRWMITIIGTLLLFASVALPIRKANRSEVARNTAEQLAQEAVAAYDRRMHGVLIPMSGLLAELMAAPTALARERQQAQIKQAVVGYAIDNISGTEPRACLFEFQDGTPQKLVCTTLWKGRTKAPRQEFVQGDLAGDEAFRVLRSKATKYVEEVTTQNSPGMPQGRDYKTYLQAPVYNDDHFFGLLCVDAPNPGDLKESDRRLAELLAQLLGVALAIK